MPTDCPTNDLIHALIHATGETRATAHVGRLRAHCEQTCTDWLLPGDCDEDQSPGCRHHVRSDWIEILIRPGGECRMVCLRHLPPLGVVSGVDAGF